MTRVVFELNTLFLLISITICVKCCRLIFSKMQSVETIAGALYTIKRYSKLNLSLLILYVEIAAFFIMVPVALNIYLFFK